MVLLMADLMHKMKTEGDINLSEERKKWQQEYLDQQSNELLKRDNKCFLSQSLSTPCLNVLESAEGIYIEDQQGKKLMDFHGNNVHQFGFKNPKIIEAVKKEMDKLPFSTRRYTNLKTVELAERLAEIAPGNLNKVLFAPGGSEAVSMAVKLSRKITGDFKMISMWDSFHGATLDAISVGGQAQFSRGMGPLLSGVEHVLPFDSYRCPFGECSECNFKCLDYLEFVLSRNDEIGALIIETIRNTDVKIPPKIYYKRIRKLCSQYNVLLILDEIPIALGRTGQNFAFEHYGIVPDILILGKGLGGGVFPFSAIICREDFDQADDISLGHFTHEKSPTAAAAALAALDFLKEEKLLSQTRKMGEYLGSKLKKLQQKYEIIGDVRGIGLLYGIELVEDRKTKEKAALKAEKIMYSALTKGLNFKISKTNTISLSPPLIINKDQIDQAVNILDQSIAEVLKNN